MVSVCMATYNGEKYIKSQIDSILCQLDSGDELIISDDGSTDDTITIVKEIHDERIVVKKNRFLHGYTGNFYSALSYAKGDIIFLSDQDDLWLPNKVSITQNALMYCDFAVSDAIEVNDKLEEMCDSRFEKYKIKNGFWSNLIKTRYLGCCMAFNRKVLKSIFPVPTYTNEIPHDLWIALVAEKYFKTTLISTPLIMYRRHDDNVSNGGTKSNRSIMKRVSSRYWYYREIKKAGRRIKKDGE